MTKKKRTPAEELIDSVMDDLRSPNATRSVSSASSLESASESSSDATAILSQAPDSQVSMVPPQDSNTATVDKTLIVQRSPSPSGLNPEEAKTSFGVARNPQSSGMQTRPSNPIASASEMQMIQAENLKMAQSRINELEREAEKIRKENELLYSASEISRQKSEELSIKISQIEKQRSEQAQNYLSEIHIYKETLAEKDSEVRKYRRQIDDLEGRLASDLKKIRVRERELENRLEISKLEKATLVKSKDDHILDLKLKIDQAQQGLELARRKNRELQQKIDDNQDQMGRTVRALRLALTNLEAHATNESTDLTLVPLKKAE